MLSYRYFVRKYANVNEYFNDSPVSVPLSYCLFHFPPICSSFNWYETSFHSIIAARDKWLSPNGLIFPDSFSLHLTAINEPEFQNARNYWTRVYDFDMSVIRQAEATKSFQYNLKPCQVILIGPDGILAQECTNVFTISTGYLGGIYTESF